VVSACMSCIFRSRKAKALSRGAQAMQDISGSYGV
jgi:hypothetical protein